MAATLPYASNVIVGTLGVDDVLASKQVRDVTPGLYQLYDQNNESPLMALLSKVSFGRSAWNPKHEWHTKDLFPRFDSIASTGTITGAGTPTITFPANNVNLLRVGDEIIFLGVTGTTNHAVVTSISGSNVTVESIDGNNLPSVTNGTQYHIVALAAGGFSQMPNPKHVKDEADYNYPQFLRYPTTLDIYELDMKQYTGSEEEERIKEDMRAIKVAFEDLMFFGERAKRTSSDGVQYFMRGLKEFISNAGGNNILDWSAGLTRSQWDEYLLEGPCKVGSNTKFLFTSSQLYLQIYSFERDIKRIVGTTTVMGINFDVYLAPGGKRLLIHHHHLLHGPYEKWGFIVDPKYLYLLPYGKNKPFTFHEGIQEPDRSGKANEWRILATMEVSRIEPHGWIHV